MRLSLWLFSNGCISLTIFLTAMDRGKITLLGMFDLSAASTLLIMLFCLGGWKLVLVFEMSHWTGLHLICLVGVSKFLFMAHWLCQHF